MTESYIFRKQPLFKRSEVLQWDEWPVPVSSESYRPASHRGDADNLSLQRESRDHSSWVLLGDGTRKEIELSGGWDCALDFSLADGLRCWTRQRAINDSIMRMWTTIHVPGMDRTLVYTGCFEVTPDRIRGGSVQMGHLTIIRDDDGLAISLENRELGIQRDWRMDRPSHGKVLIYDLWDPAASHPTIIASSDHPASLHKTTRWLVFELTGLIVADGFLSWDIPDEINAEASMTQPQQALLVSA
jgi:hypothetical protein